MGALTSDVAIGLVHLSHLQDTNIDILEPGEGLLPEDEVRNSTDLAVGVELQALVREKGVLVAVDRATIVGAAVLSGDGNGLRSGAICVVDVDIVELEVGRVDPQSAGVIVVETIGLAEVASDGGTVADIARVVGGVAVNSHIGCDVDDDILSVHALVEEDATARGNIVYSLLDSCEVTSICGHS